MLRFRFKFRLNSIFCEQHCYWKVVKISKECNYIWKSLNSCKKYLKNFTTHKVRCNFFYQIRNWQVILVKLAKFYKPFWDSWFWVFSFNHQVEFNVNKLSLSKIKVPVVKNARFNLCILSIRPKSIIFRPTQYTNSKMKTIFSKLHALCCFG